MNLRKVALVLALALPCLAFGQATSQTAPEPDSAEQQQKRLQDLSRLIQKADLRQMSGDPEGVDQQFVNLISLENNWNYAWTKRDVAMLDKFLADEYTGVGFDGILTTKAQGLAHLKSGDFTVRSVSAQEIRVRIYGDIAVVAGLNTIEAQFKGKDISGPYRFTDTFFKRGDRWQCVASHYSRLTTGAPSLPAQAGAPGPIQAQIRWAMKEPAAVLVVLDVSDKYHVFESSAVGEFTGTRVTLKADSRAFLNVELLGGEKGKPRPHDADALARELYRLWKNPQGGGNRFLAVVSEGAVGGETGTLPKEMTLELKRVVFVSNWPLGVRPPS